MLFTRKILSMNENWYMSTYSFFFFIHNALTHTMLWQSEVLSNNLIKAMELITLYHVGGRIQIFLLSWLWNLSCLFGCFYGLLWIQCRWWNLKFCWCFKSLLFCQNLKYFFLWKFDVVNSILCIVVVTNGFIAQEL